MRPSRPAEKPQSFLRALNAKYVGHGPGQDDEQQQQQQIVISGKVAEEMGFDKIRQKQAQVKELRIVILDGMRVDSATGADDEASIAETCPKITQLDLSRNLFERFGPVVEICRDLRALRKLSVK